MNEKLKEMVKQFFKFCAVGVLNTIISFAITYGVIFLVNKINPKISINNFVLIFLASLLGFFVSGLNAYYWNNKYVFKKTQKGNLKPLLKSYLCYGTIFVFSYFLNAFVFTKLLNLPNILIPVLQIFICTPLNFLSNKLWAFK